MWALVATPVWLRQKGVSSDKRDDLVKLDRPRMTLLNQYFGLAGRERDIYIYYIYDVYKKDSRKSTGRNKVGKKTEQDMLKGLKEKSRREKKQEHGQVV